MVQDAAGARDVQLFVCENEDGLDPVTVIPLTTSVAPPVLVSVTDKPLEEPRLTEPNARLSGEKPTDGEVPVPDNGTVCGDPGASSVKVRFAALDPVACGVKVTPTSQNATGASVDPQVSEAIRKSPAFVPVRVMLVMLSVALPVLVRRVDSAAEVVDTCWLPKERLVGEKLAMDCVPVPDKATVCGEPTALSVKDSAAVFAPELVGVNVTLTLQVAFGASDVTHVFAEIVNMAALVPVSATAEMVRVAPPVLVTVVDSAALVVSTRVLGKAIEAGLKLIAAVPAPTPVTGTL